MNAKKIAALLLAVVMVLGLAACGSKANAPAAAPAEKPAEAAPAAPADNGVRDALLSMGFTTAEIDLALKGAPEGAGESTLLQHALKRLSFL